KNNASGADVRDLVRRQTLAPWRTAFDLRRKRQPQLIAMETIRSDRTRVMPDAATCLKPLETARSKFAMCARRVFIAHRSGQQKRQRRDARMRVHGEHRLARGPEVEVIQKHERLDPLAQIARAEQPCHGAMDAALRAGDDPSER